LPTCRRQGTLWKKYIPIHLVYIQNICIFEIFIHTANGCAHAHAGHTHAIKNIGQKVLNLNDITFNKRFGGLIGRCFDMPYVSYCHPLQTFIFANKDLLEAGKRPRPGFFLILD
ncbi:MAG: hypothetical protein KKG99_03620, partial [Bacteroidetes bacterium]|nr:hypothetical protein [Bacteroidota bacterium]